jgi:hypothetical protein
MSSVTGSTSLCLNTAGGNVGIGTKNPGYTLDVNGTIRTVAPILVDSSAAGANYSVLRLTTGGDGNNYIQSAAAQTAGSRANLIFSGWFGDSESMRLTSTGRLSIGTTSPQRLLDVNGSIRGGSYEGKEFNGGYISLNSYYDGGWLKWTTSGGGFIIRGDNTLDSTLGGTTFITQTTASTATTTRLTILHGSGNVGIGTTTPLQPFHVYSGNYGNPTGGSGAGTDSNVTVRVQMSTVGLDIGTTSIGSTWIQNRQPSTSLSTVLPLSLNPLGGNVGIGTTSPSALLHSIVNTTANIPDAIIGNHVIKSYNRALALAATSFSNICTITTTNGSAVVYLDVVQSETGAASNASYIVPMAYNNTGNAWRLLLAISISNQNAPNYAQVLFKQTNNEATFALYRPSVASTGTANFTCTFRISQSQVNTATFADKTDTTTLAAVTPIYSYTQLTQTTTGVGIGTSSPERLLDVAGDASINSVRVGRGVGSVGTNTVVGVIAMNNNTTGAKNTAIGYQALLGNTTAQNNTAVGYQALLGNTTAQNNTAVGTQAMQTNTIGGNNTAVGMNAMNGNTTGISNTAVGTQAMQANTIGGNNTAVGMNAMHGNTTGNNNTAVGQLAGYNITTGSRNVVIGSDGAASTATISNEVTINNGVHFCRFQGTGTTWLFTSDARDKTNISDIPVGIDFINNLRPVSYQWDRRDWYDDKQSDGSKTEPIASLGFIAQEVDEAVQMSGHADVLSRLIYKNDPENLMLSETGIIPILVKAVQELSAQVKDLQTEVALLKSGA